MFFSTPRNETDYGTEVLPGGGWMYVRPKEKTVCGLRKKTVAALVALLCLTAVVVAPTCLLDDTTSPDVSGSGRRRRLGSAVSDRKDGQGERWISVAVDKLSGKPGKAVLEVRQPDAVNTALSAASKGLSAWHVAGTVLAGWLTCGGYLAAVGAVAAAATDAVAHWNPEAEIIPLPKKSGCVKIFVGGAEVPNELTDVTHRLEWEAGKASPGDVAHEAAFVAELEVEAHSHAHPGSHADHASGHAHKVTPVFGALLNTVSSVLDVAQVANVGRLTLSERSGRAAMVGEALADVVAEYIRKENKNVVLYARCKDALQLQVITGAKWTNCTRELVEDKEGKPEFLKVTIQA